MQKGAGKALGSVIAEGDFRRAFPGSCKRGGCVKQKSLQRPPTIRFTDSVLRTRFLIILRFGGGVGGGGGGGGCGGGSGDFNISPNSKICPIIDTIPSVRPCARSFIIRTRSVPSYLAIFVFLQLPC